MHMRGDETCQHIGKYAQNASCYSVLTLQESMPA